MEDNASIVRDSQTWSIQPLFIVALNFFKGARMLGEPISRKQQQQHSDAQSHTILHTHPEFTGPKTYPMDPRVDD